MEADVQVQDEAFTVTRMREEDGTKLHVEVLHRDGTDATISGVDNQWNIQLGGQRPAWDGLILALLRLAAAASLMRTKGAEAADFTRRPPRVQTRIVAGALLGLACAHHVAAQSPRGGSQPVAILDAAHADAQHAPDATTLSVPMPDKPMEGQMLPPCDRRKGFKELNGACWIGPFKGECPEQAYEFKGECYSPVEAKQPKRVPRAMDGAAP